MNYIIKCLKSLNFIEKVYFFFEAEIKDILYR
jgi:hypothetical protein